MLWSVMVAIVFFLIGRFIEMVITKSRLEKSVKAFNQEVDSLVKDIEKKARKPVRRINIKSIYAKFKGDNVVSFAEARKLKLN